MRYCPGTRGGWGRSGGALLPEISALAALRIRGKAGGRAVLAADGRMEADHRHAGHKSSVVERPALIDAVRAGAALRIACHAVSPVSPRVEEVFQFL